MIGVLSPATPALGVISRAMKENLRDIILKALIFGLVDTIITAVVALTFNVLSVILLVALFLLLALLEYFINNNKKDAIVLILLGLLLSVAIMFLKPIFGATIFNILKFSASYIYILLVPIVDLVGVVLGAIAYNIYDKLISV